jgi:hypothetical protein
MPGCQFCELQLIFHGTYWYNFLLIEMIMHCNHTCCAELEVTGHVPYSIPHDELLGPTAWNGRALVDDI